MSTDTMVDLHIILGVVPTTRHPRIQESISILFFDFLIVFDDTLIKNMHIYFLDTLFLTTETVSWERK